MAGVGTRSGQKTFKKDEGQTTLDGKILKRVSWGDRELNDFKKKIEEEVRKIKQEAVDIERLRLEIKTRDLELLERLDRLEKIIENLEFREKEREDKRRKEEESRLAEWSTEDATSQSSAQGSRYNLLAGDAAVSVRSEISGTSRMSRFSSLSNHEVIKMKRLLAEKEKKENKDVIVIRGLTCDERKCQIREMVENFIKNKIEVEVEVKSVWCRGKVILARLKSGEDKERVMNNKNKLAGSRVFIDNYRNFEERKRQDEIYTWVKEKKEKGWQVKIGFGKIFYKNSWVKWEDREALVKRILEEEGKDKLSEKEVERGVIGTAKSKNGNNRREFFA